MAEKFYGTLQTLKQKMRDDINLAKNPYDILLAMAKEIGKITGEDNFYTEIRENIISIYSHVFNEERILELELEEVAARREKIAAALNSDNFSDDDKKRMKFALTRHDKEIERLKDELRIKNWKKTSN